ITSRPCSRATLRLARSASGTVRNGERRREAAIRSSRTGDEGDCLQCLELDVVADRDRGGVVEGDGEEFVDTGQAAWVRAGLAPPPGAVPPFDEGDLPALAIQEPAHRPRSGRRGGDDAVEPELAVGPGAWARHELPPVPVPVGDE